MQIISTVTSAAASYDLTTLTNVKLELSITDTTNDALLARYITSASLAAAQYCNRVFVVETITDSFYAERRENSRPLHVGAEPLQLSRFPLVSVTSVVENAVTLVAGTDYIADLTNGQLIRLSSDGTTPTRWLVTPITVVYVAGFSTIPADLEDAAIRMITARYLAKGRDRNIRQDSIPGLREVQYWVASGSDAGNLSPDVADILDNYRIPVVA